MLGNDCVEVYLSNGIGPKPVPELRRTRVSNESEKARERIIVVDDDKMVANTTGEILCADGFDVKVAYDGQTALVAAAEFRPDYLLTDVLMPRMNGVELAIAITKSMPTVRIILFSGQAGISDIVLEGHNRGYDFELLPKPIHPTRLLDHFKRR